LPKDNFFKTKAETKFAIHVLELYIQRLLKERLGLKKAESFIRLNNTQLILFQECIDEGLASTFGAGFTELKGTELRNARILFRLKVLKVNYNDIIHE